MMKLSLLAILPVMLFVNCITPKSSDNYSDNKNKVLTGADQTEKYLPFLRGKRIGVLGNPTTVIGKTHFVDSMKTIGINIVKVFGPEHGFRGNASAGVRVNDEKDSATGIPIISLYGSKRKPSAA